MRASRVFVLALALTACSRERAKPSKVEVESADVPRDTLDDQARRKRMVDSLEASGMAKSPRVLDALRKVPRHLFVPEAFVADAYLDEALPIGNGQTISQPSIVAEMTEALDPKPDSHVLEIGTGSGYQAAVLSLLARDVSTIEIVPELADRAKKRLAELGYPNVEVLNGNGYAGWPERAPFDRIMLTAAPSMIPQTLIDQLGEGGTLVAPEGEDSQWLIRLTKEKDEINRERIERVRFVPMVR